MLGVANINSVQSKIISGGGEDGICLCGGEGRGDIGIGIVISSTGMFICDASCNGWNFFIISIPMSHSMVFKCISLHPT